MPHIALLARRLNDGYHTKYLTPAFGWRYRCKQVEHAFELLSVTVVPLIRTAIMAECAYYYYEAYTKMGHMIVRPDYLIASWVAVHCLLLAVLFFTQMVGTRVIYRHMYLKSKKQQRLAAAEAQQPADDKLADTVLDVGGHNAKASSSQQVGCAEMMMCKGHQPEQAQHQFRNASPSDVLCQQPSDNGRQKSLDGVVNTWSRSTASTPTELRASSTGRRAGDNSTDDMVYRSASSSVLVERTVS